MARQERIGLFSTISPTGVDQSAGQSLRALAGLSEQVGDIAFNIGAKKRQKEGQIAGADVQRDEEGQIVAPELKSDLTIFGESFNKSAVLAYKAQIGLDAKSKLEELQNTHKLDPEAFKQQAEAAKQGSLAKMPEEIAIEAGLEYDVRIANHYSSLMKDFYKRETEDQQATANEWVESATDDILNTARSGDEQLTQELILANNDKLEEFVNEGLISPSKVVQLKERLSENIAKQKTLGEIDRIVFSDDFTLEEKAQKGAEFLDELRTQDFKDLHPDQKDSLVNVVGVKVNGLQTQLAEIQSKKTLDQTRQISNLKVKADLGLEKPEDLMEETETLFNNGLITGGERTSIITDILKGQQGKADIANSDAEVAKKISGDNAIVLDQKTVDDYYERNVQEQIADLPPSVKIAEQALLVERLKIVPKRVKQELSNNILSGDPELIQQASDLVNRLDEVPGLVDLAVNANQRAFINTVTDLSVSMEAEEAVKLATELTDPRDKSRIEARENEIKSDKMREDYPDVVEDAFEGFFGGDLLVNNVNKESVNREYQQLFESFFKAGMTKDRAEEKAISLLRTNWKESQFGFMKHPPETFYSVGGDVDYIKEQLTKDITTGFTGFEFNKENLFLLSDEQTSRKASQGQPDYRVMVIDNNGEIQVLQGRWMPDMQAEAEKQTKENEELFTEERGKQASRVPDLGSIN